MATLSCRLCGRRNIPNAHDCAAAQAVLDAQAPKVVSFQLDPKGTCALVALDEHGRLWRYWNNGEDHWVPVRPPVDDEVRYAAGIAADKQETEKAPAP